MEKNSKYGLEQESIGNPHYLNPQPGNKLPDLTHLKETKDDISNNSEEEVHVSGAAENTHQGGIHTNDAQSTKQYFRFYSTLCNQQNMLADHVRTGLYYDAITKNKADFMGRVVMDVGAGTGILSIFAA